MTDVMPINDRKVPAPPYDGPDERDQVIGTVASELSDVVDAQGRLLWWVRSLTAAILAGAVAVLAGGCVG